VGADSIAVVVEVDSIAVVEVVPHKVVGVLVAEDNTVAVVAHKVAGEEHSTVLVVAHKVVVRMEVVT
jgi:hypothetical protein